MFGRSLFLQLRTLLSTGKMPSGKQATLVIWCLGASVLIGLTP
jgi:hypothetical protein